MLLSLYPYIKTLHLLTVSLWMASLIAIALTYLPHTESKDSSVQALLVQIENKLLHFWANPMMFLTLVFGTLLLASQPAFLAQGWIHLKLFFVVCMCGFHGTLAKKGRQINENTEPLALNKIKKLPLYPLVFVSFIIFLVMLKPV